jgi:hypothetical protein
MRDPELMLRAQRAATELERAWDRWRTIHGLDTEPLPPVSSYVGYSLEEPWGQPRVVFGIAAAEAEHLAALLDRHDCAGPVYAAMTAQGLRADVDAGARAADPDRGRGRIHVPTQVQVPAQVQAAVPARDLAAEQAPAGSPIDPLDPLGTANHADVAEPEPMAGNGAQEPSAEQELLGEGQPGLVAFRPRHDPASYQEEGDEPGQLDDQASQAAEAGRASGGWARRLPGGHALPRQKRSGGAAKGAGSKPEGKERAGLADMAADLAGWAAGELPGQASHRRVPHPPAGPDRRPLG